MRCTPEETARECVDIALVLLERVAGRGDHGRAGRDERGSGSRRERRDRDYEYDDEGE